LTLPTGILAATTAPPEPTPIEETVEPAKVVKAKKKKPAAADKVEDMKLYLTEDVRFRLRMLAFKRNAKISTIANEVLDKALPRWTLERTD
jgi:hypothetical protein